MFFYSKQKIPKEKSPTKEKSPNRGKRKNKIKKQNTANHPKKGKRTQK